MGDDEYKPDVSDNEEPQYLGSQQSVSNSANAITDLTNDAKTDETNGNNKRNKQPQSKGKPDVFVKTRQMQYVQMEGFAKLEMELSRDGGRKIVHADWYKSELWKYFREVEPSKDGHNQTVACLLCYLAPGNDKKTGRKKPPAINLNKYSAIQNLSSHMRKCHTEKFKDYQLSSSRSKYTPYTVDKYKELREEVEQERKESKRVKIQKRITEFAKNDVVLRNSTVVDLALVNRTLTRMLTENNVPFELVRKRLFRKFVALLNKSYVAPQVYSIGSCQEDLHLFSLLQLKASLKRASKFFAADNGGCVSFLSIQFDGWTTQSGVNYLGVSAVYYDPQFGKHVYVVLAIYAVPGKKTAYHLGKILNDILSAYDINPTLVCHTISDQEGAVTNAGSSIAGTHVHDPCFCHKLQTALKHATGLPEKRYKKDNFEPGKVFFDKIRRVVRLFTTGSQKLKKFMDIQRLLFEDSDDPEVKKRKPLTVLNFITTRWTCAFLVLCRLLRIRTALDKWFNIYRETNNGKHPDTLTDSDWDEVVQVAALLSSWYSATVKMQSESYVCRSYGYILVSDIILELRDATTEKIVFVSPDSKETYKVQVDTPMTLSMKNRMVFWLEKAWPEPSKSELLSMILDPRLRDSVMSYQNEKYKEKGLKLLQAELQGVESRLGDAPKRSVDGSQDQTETTIASAQPNHATSLDTGDQDNVADAARRKRRKLWNTQIKERGNDLNNQWGIQTMIQRYLEAQAPVIKYMPDCDIFDLMEHVNPFDWWNALMTANPRLKLLGQVACRVLSSPATSSFSERIFSFGGVTTSCLRSSTKPRRLNLSQLIKFNGKLCSEESWDNMTAEMGSLFEDFGVSRDNLGSIGEVIEKLAPKSTESSLTETEKAILRSSGEIKVQNLDFEVENPELFSEKVCCVNCHGVPLTEATCDKHFYNEGQLKCDGEICSLADKTIELETKFYTCAECDEYDLCSSCYLNIEFD